MGDIHSIHAFFFENGKGGYIDKISLTKRSANFSIEIYKYLVKVAYTISFFNFTNLYIKKSNSYLKFYSLQFAHTNVL